ncbi:MAG: sialidase family protein [Kiritimatiellia bacterium]
MRLKWVRKVFSDGMHNAFTGLAFFKERHFLAFRHAVRHSAPPGSQFMMTSPDGESWTLLKNTVFPAPPALPPGEQMDSRDNYFLNLENELRLYSFASPPFLPAEDRYMLPHYSTVQVTRDGDTWTAPRAVMEGVILWKPIFWREKFWCAGYRRDKEAGYVVELYRSEDGFEWTRGELISGGTETFLLPMGDDTLRAFVRAEKPPYYMKIMESRAPFEDWREKAIIPRIIQAPHVEKVNVESLLSKIT